MNRTASKALFHLSQPVTLISIFILFVNDHLLRVYWPSWITGKLGDIAWLYFAPFALAVILGWLIPISVKHHAKVVGYLSFGTIAVLFALANAFPSTNQLLVEFLERLLSVPIHITRDPTDLITLGSCIIGWRIWV